MSCLQDGVHKKQLVRYRVNPHSLSNQHFEMYRAVCQVLHENLAYAVGAADQRAVEAAKFGLARLRHSYACIRFAKARVQYQQGRLISSLWLILRAIELSPRVVTRELIAFVRDNCIKRSTGQSSSIA